MKKLILLLLLFPLWSNAQTYQYSYDANGNRTIRAHVQLKRGNTADTAQTTNPYTDQLAELELRLYPNPTQDQLHIDANGAALEVTHLRVFDNRGTLVFQKETAHLPLQLDFSQYAAGMYTVALQVGEEVKRYKILVTQ